MNTSPVSGRPWKEDRKSTEDRGGGSYKCAAQALFFFLYFLYFVFFSAFVSENTLTEKYNEVIEF